MREIEHVITIRIIKTARVEKEKLLLFGNVNIWCSYCCSWSNHIPLPDPSSPPPFLFVSLARIVSIVLCGNMFTFEQSHDMGPNDTNNDDNLFFPVSTWIFFSSLLLVVPRFLSPSPFWTFGCEFAPHSETNRSLSQLLKWMSRATGPCLWRKKRVRGVNDRENEKNVSKVKSGPAIMCNGCKSN